MLPPRRRAAPERVACCARAHAQVAQQKGCQRTAKPGARRRRARARAARSFKQQQLPPCAGGAPWHVLPLLPFRHDSAQRSVRGCSARYSHKRANGRYGNAICSYRCPFPRRLRPARANAGCLKRCRLARQADRDMPKIAPLSLQEKSGSEVSRVRQRQRREVEEKPHQVSRREVVAFMVTGMKLAWRSFTPVTP